MRAAEDRAALADDRATPPARSAAAAASESARPGGGEEPPQVVRRRRHDATDEVRDDAADGERAAPAVVTTRSTSRPYPWCAPVKRLIRHLLQCPSGPARCHGAARCRVCDPPDLPATLEKLRYLNVQECIPCERDSHS